MGDPNRVGDQLGRQGEQNLEWMKIGQKGLHTIEYKAIEGGIYQKGSDEGWKRLDGGG